MVRIVARWMGRVVVRCGFWLCSAELCDVNEEESFQAYEKNK